MDRQIGPRQARGPSRPWIAAARALAEADGNLRKRGGPGGAMKTAIAYLLGLLAIRFCANAYIMLGPLASMAPPEDSAAIAWISACLACLPLAAAAALSEAPAGVSRRLDLSPLGAAARLSAGALAPMASRLAVTAIAAALPAVAALPLLPASPAAYAATVSSTAAIAFFSATALKAALGIAYAQIFGRSLARSPRGGAHAALALLLAMLAASNPTPSFREGRAVLGLFNSAAAFPKRLVPSFIAATPPGPAVRARASADIVAARGADLEPEDTGVSAATVALCVAALAVAAAALSALEAAVARRASARPRAALGRRRAAALRLPKAPFAAAAIIRAAEAHDRAAPALAASLALAAAALAQRARPIIPAVAGAALIAARAWRAFAGLAVDSAASRRLAMAPRPRARAEAYWLAAAVALAAASASPLFAAALALL